MRQCNESFYNTYICILTNRQGLKDQALLRCMLFCNNESDNYEVNVIGCTKICNNEVVFICVSLLHTLVKDIRRGPRNHDGNLFSILYTFILLTSAIVPGINYFVVITHPLQLHGPKRSKGVHVLILSSCYFLI